MDGLFKDFVTDYIYSGSGTHALRPTKNKEVKPDFMIQGSGAHVLRSTKNKEVKQPNHMTYA
ncbi:Hypothetical predicted protein, partial [Pelobates cultripes]